MENEHKIENAQGFLAKAFVSCSQRDEDQGFVCFVEHILRHCKIEPLGLASCYPFSPAPLVERLKTNAARSDFFVVVATPRYVQWDMVSRASGLALSDQLEVDGGMPHFLGRPVALFVKRGTDMKNFLPGVDHFVTLDGTHKDTQKQWDKVTGLLDHTVELASGRNGKKGNGPILKLLGRRLAQFKKSRPWWRFPLKGN